jgi:hypothetical protein
LSLGAIRITAAKGVGNTSKKPKKKKAKKKKKTPTGGKLGAGLPRKIIFPKF